MENEGSYVALGLKVWKAQIDRANKFFWRPLVRGGSAGNSARQEQATLLVGTSDSHTRRDAAVVGAGRSVSSRVRCRLRLESRQIASRHSFARTSAPSMELRKP